MGTSTSHKKKRIGELLVDAGVIKQHHLDQALEEQRDRQGRIVEILIANGYLDIQTFITFLASQPGVAGFDLYNYNIPKEIVGLVPQDFAQKNEVFPIDRLGSLLTVGMACPLDSKTIAELQELTGLRVKALLCPAKDIHAMIRRYYIADGSAAGDVSLASLNLPERPKKASKKAEDILDGSPREEIETTLKLGSVAHLIQKLDTLPALPATVQRVQEAMLNPDVSMKDISEVVVMDLAVSAKLLKVVNSAAFGFPTKIDDVHRALTLLGLKETYMIVLASSVPDLFERNKKFDYQGFWERSLFTALVASGIARAMGGSRTGSYFTAGLLHDLGQVALAEAVPDRYASIDLSLAGAELVAQEEETLGLNHAEAGYLLAEQWDMPDDLLEPIRFHHQPQHATIAPEMVTVIALSACFEEACPEGEEAVAEALSNNAVTIEELGLSTEDMAGIVKEAEASSHESL